MWLGKLQDDEGDQADQGNTAQADDQVRLQPVLAMAFLEKHLQAAQPKAERDDAGVIGTFQQLPVRLFLLKPV